MDNFEILTREEAIIKFFDGAIIRCDKVSTFEPSYIWFDDDECEVFASHDNEDWFDVDALYIFSFFRHKDGYYLQNN